MCLAIRPDRVQRPIFTCSIKMQTNCKMNKLSKCLSKKWHHHHHIMYYLQRLKTESLRAIRLHLRNELWNYHVNISMTFLWKKHPELIWGAKNMNLYHVILWVRITSKTHRCVTQHTHLITEKPHILSTILTKRTLKFSKLVGDILSTQNYPAK